ncbi:DUF192 domain-containing protein [Caulobacter sp. KR2-114]|uniref:DUF192 domain-containing protein n=1 Tax=Caulobacter sp. KR2-114 TaxID=3400912 RepID=UPI003C0046ED
MQQFPTAGSRRAFGVVTARIVAVSVLAGLALAASAVSATTVAPYKGPRLADGAPCTAGQKPLRTEPLQIATARGRYRFTVEMADTDVTREIGLMCRTAVAPEAGMLFDFKTPQEVSFWMRNTITPLDMLFIAQDGRIISIARNAIPENEAPIPSGGPIRGVLELRGGRAAEIGAAPGDRVSQRIFHR